MAQFGSALALGARCRRFESCLPDATKSQSPADISTAPQGAVFYCYHSGVRKTCVKPADGNPFLRTTFTDTADKLRAVDNVSPTASAQAFLTGLRTNVIHQINSCLLLDPQKFPKEI